MSTLKGNPKYKALKSTLRYNMTAPERKMWSRLRLNQFYSLKFRRQHGIGNYIVDFYCPELKVALELDGNSHYEGSQVQTDIQRDLFLRSQGVKTFRYLNDDVMKNIDGVLLDLVERLQLEVSTSPGPSLSPPGTLRRRGGNL